jgi:hypothetical protein
MSTNSPRPWAIVAQHSHDPGGARVLHEQQAGLGRAATGCSDASSVRCNGTASHRSAAPVVLPPKKHPVHLVPPAPGSAVSAGPGLVPWPVLLFPNKPTY